MKRRDLLKRLPILGAIPFLPAHVTEKVVANNPRFRIYGDPLAQKAFAVLYCTLGQVNTNRLRNQDIFKKMYTEAAEDSIKRALLTVHGLVCDRDYTVGQVYARPGGGISKPKWVDEDGTILVRAGIGKSGRDSFEAWFRFPYTLIDGPPPQDNSLSFQEMEKLS